MRLHILGLPHTQVTKAYRCCAYTQKVLKLAEMMIDEGIEVTVYAGEENETRAELATCIRKEEQVLFGFANPEDYNRMTWDRTAPIWEVFHKRAIAELKQRTSAGDIIGTFAGLCDESIKDAFPECRFVELGIGYEGAFADYRIFESWAWLHTVYGSQQSAYQANGRFYDAVIPNFFDPADFPASTGHTGYVLYVGRMIGRKGLHIVADLAERFRDTEFILAGHGAIQEGSEIRFDFGQDDDGKPTWDTIHGKNLRYIGPIDAEKRGRLMSNARALICPTLYIGPFEGVHAEAMLCGTPVLTTPWGIFSESYDHGVHGFKCHTMNEFTDGLITADTLDRNVIREYAMKRYSMPAVAKQYTAYFQRLAGLDSGGFYEK